MAPSKRDRVGEGLDALRRGLGPYVLQEMKRHHGDRLETALENVLYEHQFVSFRQGGGTDEAFLEAVDVDALLKIMRGHYSKVFFSKLRHDPLTYTKELTGVRHKWAHPPSSTPFTTESAARALETMMLLLRAVGAGAEAEEVNAHLHAVRYGDQGDRYEIDRSLGSGGMGEVYLARDKDLDRDVAIKYLHSKHAKEPISVQRFEREAKSAARLSHPNIVSVHARGYTEDTHYIVMEHVPGETLKDYIGRDGPLPAKRAAEVAKDIAAALDTAHQNGVIHRDVKPQNVLITKMGYVKVADFGIARTVSDSTITNTGDVLGSAHYMSPEQALGETVDSRSDLYSLGVVLYEMLTSERPYNADTPAGLIMKHINEPLRPPREINSKIPENINALTVKLLSESPEERYQSAAELLVDLKKILNDLGKVTGDKDPGTAETEPLHDGNSDETGRTGSTLAEIVVSPDPGEGFRTIGQALQEAQPGGRIRVRPGVYREGLVIDKPVEIVGERGPDGDAVIESTEGPCLSISADMGTLRGLVLRRGLVVGQREDSDEQEEEHRTAVMVSAGQVTVEECNITSAAGDCIIVQGSEANPTIRGCRIHHGKEDGIWVRDNGQGLVQDCDIFENVHNGVAIETDSSPTIRGCKIHHGEGDGISTEENAKGIVENCDIFANAYAGVFISTEANPTIKGCKIHHGKQDGIWVKDKGRGAIEECEIFENVYNGVEIKSGAAPIIRRCRIHEGKQNGILIKDKGQGFVEDCEIFENAYPGVGISTGANPIIRGCKIHSSEQNGIVANKNGRGVVEDCEIFENAYSGVFISTEANFTIRRCKIYSCKGVGVAAKDKGQGYIEDCAIFENALWSIHVADAKLYLKRCTITGNEYEAIFARGSGTIVTHNNCHLKGNARGTWKATDGAKVYEK